MNTTDIPKTSIDLNIIVSVNGIWTPFERWIVDQPNYEFTILKEEREEKIYNVWVEYIGKESDVFTACQCSQKQVNGRISHEVPVALIREENLNDSSPKTTIQKIIQINIERMGSSPIFIRKRDSFESRSCIFI